MRVLITVSLLVALLAISIYTLRNVLYSAGGITAKRACASLFIQNRTDLAHPELEGLIKVAGFEVPYSLEADVEKKQVSSTVLGMVQQVAQYHILTGCTLLPKKEPPKEFGMRVLDTTLSPDSTERLKSSSFTKERDWPVGDRIPSLKSGDYGALQQVLDSVFSEAAEGPRKNTRAFIVLHKGEIVAEKYAEPFKVDTPHMGWSMTKSLLAVLIGRRVQQEKLSITEPMACPEWDKDKDPRSNITVDHMLRMSSGLAFHENYGIFGDPVEMLFGLSSYDSAEYAANKRADYSPDEKWSYSSGTTNMLSRKLRQTFTNDEEYWLFPQDLWRKLGMSSMVMEIDGSGTFVGSSFSYATARDWARFGLFCSQQGMWQGEQLLPVDWMKYSFTPTKLAPKQEYGAHWWLNAGEAKNASNRVFPDVPQDAYFAWGFEEQIVMIIPSRETVIVRLGLTKADQAFQIKDINDFTSKVLEALERAS